MRLPLASSLRSPLRVRKQPIRSWSMAWVIVGPGTPRSMAAICASTAVRRRSAAAEVESGGEPQRPDGLVGSVLVVSWRGWISFWFYWVGRLS